MIFIISEKIWKTIIGYRTRLFKNPFKKVLHKAGKFFGIKNEDAVVTKSSNDKLVKQEPVEEIIIPPHKKIWNIKQI